MEDPVAVTEAEPQSPRPRVLAVASLSTGIIGLLSAQHAEGHLELASERAPSTPDSLASAMQHAFWRSAQDHRRAVVGSEVATLLLSVTLFLASARVFLRVRGAGWLWRQALAGMALVTLVSLWVDRALIPARVSAFARAVALRPAAVPLPRGLSAEETMRAGLTVSVWATVLVLFVLLLTLALSMRPTTRAYTD